MSRICNSTKYVLNSNRPHCPRSPGHLKDKKNNLLKITTKNSPLKHDGLHGLRGHVRLDRHFKYLLHGRTMDTKKGTI